MNLKPLFTTGRVVREVYAIVSTGFLFVYLFRRRKRDEERPPGRYDSQRRWHDH